MKDGSTEAPASADASTYGEVHERLVTPRVELFGRQIYVVATIILYLLFRSDIPPTQNLIWLIIATLVIGTSLCFDVAYLVFRPNKAEMVRKWRQFDKWLTPALDLVAVSTIFLLLPHVGPEKLLIGTAFFIGYIPMQILSDPENVRANQFSTIVVLGAFASFLVAFGGEVAWYLAVLVILYAAFLYLAAGEIRALVLDAVIGRRYAVLEERQRVMRDLHDGIGNQLLGLVIKMRNGRSDPATLTDDVQSAIDELRLVTTALDDADGNLAQVLAGMRHRLDAQAAGVGVALTWEVQIDPALVLPPQLVLDVLRMLQECISNALKHSGATSVHVAVAADDALVVKVADDGRGFDPAAVRAGLGLRNIRARAAAWGGVADFVKGNSGGTLVRITVPLPNA